MAFVKLSKSPSSLIPRLPISIPPRIGLRRSEDWHIPHPSKDFPFGEWNMNCYSHNGEGSKRSVPCRAIVVPQGLLRVFGRPAAIPRPPGGVESGERCRERGERDAQGRREAFPWSLRLILRGERGLTKGEYG